MKQPKPYSFLGNNSINTSRHPSAKRTGQILNDFGMQRIISNTKRT